jgi:hypothetical protein
MPYVYFLYPLLLFLGVIVAGRAYSAKVRTVLGSVYPVWLALGVGLGVALLWCLAIYEYLIFPGYLDYIQPTVAAVSWLAVHGHPIWPNWESGDVYAMLYGPLVYLVNGVFLLINPSIFMSKLPGIGALLGAVACLWWVLRRKKTDGITAFLLIAAFLTVFDPRVTISYAGHPDSFLLFIGALTLPVAFECPLLPAAIGVGILAGLGAGFKVHGFLYAVPAALAVIARAKDRREGLRLSVAGCGAAIAVIALPFLLVSQAANADGYLRTLIMAAHHGLAMAEFSDGLLYAGSLAVPLLVVWYWWRPALGRPERWFLIGLGAAVAVTIVIGAKRGAGARHLWPFYPAYFYAMACILRADSRAADSQKPQTIMAVVVLALLATYAGWQEESYSVMEFWYGRQDIELAKIVDVENILKDHPDAEFGVSDSDGRYRDSFYRVLGVFQGGQLHLDSAAWIDLALAGIPGSVAARTLENCAVRTWVLPLGEPFALLSTYGTGEPVFSDEFREEFHSNYRLVQEDDFYQVWACK